VLPKIPEVKPLAPLAYEPKGRPDPFRSLAGRDSGESKGLTVASVKLVGIIQGRQGPLALVETSDGLGYIVKPGDVVGDGKVAEIGRDSVTFQVARRGPFVLRLRTE
jgi:Tfp pilus assembly protein PilP